MEDIPNDKTLLLPDRPENRQVDALMNLVERPQVGLLFLVPGFTETLRINGRAKASTAPKLLDSLAIKGKPPISVHRVKLYSSDGRHILGRESDKSR